MIVPINKPPGITSFGVVQRIRRAVGVKRVGHGGTLDKFAEGLLIVGIGRDATRRLAEYLGNEKEYVAEVRLGIVTDTYDRVGRVVQVRDFQPPSRLQMENLLGRFRGKISQLPPPFSAIKVEGERSYRAALRGEKVKTKPRSVTLEEIELLALGVEGFTLRVVCSKGTYIRSLANDMGQELGMGGHLQRLIRTRIGQIRLEEAENLEEFILRIKGRASN